MPAREYSCGSTRPVVLFSILRQQWPVAWSMSDPRTTTCMPWMPAREYSCGTTRQGSLWNLRRRWPTVQYTLGLMIATCTPLPFRYCSMTWDHRQTLTTAVRRGWWLDLERWALALRLRIYLLFPAAAISTSPRLIWVSIT